MRFIIKWLVSDSLLVTLVKWVWLIWHFHFTRLISTLCVPSHFMCLLSDIFAVKFEIYWYWCRVSKKQCQIRVQRTWTHLKTCFFDKNRVKKKHQNSMGHIKWNWNTKYSLVRSFPENMQENAVIPYYLFAYNNEARLVLHISQIKETYSTVFLDIDINWF